MNSLRRLVLALLALAASTLVAVGVATPAHAATAYATKPVMQMNYAQRQYGRYYTVDVTITAVIDGKPYWVDDNHGSFDLQSHVAGTAWRTVATSSEDSGHTFTFKASRTTYYRVVYSGYTGSDYSTTASTSAAKAVRVTRNLGDTFTKKTRTIKGHLSPAYRNGRITLQKSTCSSGCAWHKVTTFKTNKSSNYTYKLPIYGKATYFRLMVPGNKSYAVSYSNHWFETWRY